ncbi:hypothetical protein IAT38_006296 [Cryptococcus sp. DSM 104549]
MPVPSLPVTLTTLAPLPSDIKIIIFEEYLHTVPPGSTHFTDLICISRSVHNSHVRRLYQKVTLDECNAEGFYRGFERILDIPPVAFDFSTGLPSGKSAGEDEFFPTYPKYHLVRLISHLTLMDKTALEHTATAIRQYAEWGSPRDIYQEDGAAPPVPMFPSSSPSWPCGWSSPSL